MTVTEDQVHMLLLVAEDYICEWLPLREVYLPDVYVELVRESEDLILRIACLDTRRRILGFFFTFKIARQIILDEDRPERFLPKHLTTLVTAHAWAYQQRFNLLKEVYTKNWKMYNYRVLGLKGTDFKDKKKESQLWGHLRVDYSDYILATLDDVED